MKLSYAIVFVADMPESVRFYRDVIGLPLKYETPEWTEFATDGATFALHAAAASPDATTEAKIPGRCQPGFNVPDLAGFHERMLAAGVPCVRPPRKEFGVAIAQYTDPDGLVFSVSEVQRRA